MLDTKLEEQIQHAYDRQKYGRIKVFFSLFSYLCFIDWDDQSFLGQSITA